jgi:hypothetical protein
VPTGEEKPESGTSESSDDPEEEWDDFEQATVRLPRMVGMLYAMIGQAFNEMLPTSRIDHVFMEQSGLKLQAHVRDLAGTVS